jgi:MYXO-CTERM domain-containing protein
MRLWLTSTLVAAGVGAALCAASTAQAQECTPPRILLIMDVSSSMRNTIDDGSGGTTTKWAAAQSAIHDVLTAYGDAAQYGLMTFPGSAYGCAVGDIQVDVGVGTASSIDSWISGYTPLSGGAYTPAGQTLKTASEYPDITENGYDNYVVFVTDGQQWCDYNDSTYTYSCVTEADCALMGISAANCGDSNHIPNCNSDPSSGSGCYCVQDWPVIGTQALTNAGVTTYVVGFGSSVNARFLNEAAYVGGTALPNCDYTSQSPSCYYQATVSSELTTALGQIMQQVVTESCQGDCDIEGQRTCTTSGWTDCDAPDMVDCMSSCNTPGTQQCIDDQLTECSSEADCAAGGSGGTGGSGPTGGTGGTGAYGGTGGSAGGLSADPEDPGGCGCRLAGQPGSTGLAALGLLAGLGLAVGRRRRR